MTETDYKKVLDRLNLNEKQMLSEYDGIFHLVTAAKGAESAYILSNNN